MTEPRPRHRPRPRRRRRRGRGLLLVAALVVVFAVGVALGEALHDNPQPSNAPTSTIVRTVIPGEPSTVTVTAPTS